MVYEKLNICKIFVSDEKEKNSLLQNFGSMGVQILLENPNEDFEIPTLIVGWKKAKELFPESDINNNFIKKNLYWAFSYEEQKKEFKNQAKKFVSESITNFFSIPTVSYDTIMDGKFNDFLITNLFNGRRYYVYFHNDVCYFYGGKKTIAISLKSIDYIGESSIEVITFILNKIDCILFSYRNANGYVNFDKLKKIITLENVYWTKFSENINYEILRKRFGINDIHNKIPFIMSLLDLELTEEEERSCYRQSERDVITSWLSSRALFFNKDYKLDRRLRVRWHNYKKYTKSTYSNKRSITGRIYCVNGFNPQNLPKKDDGRKNIVSRYDGGKIVMFDYVSFETKLSLYYSKNKDFITKYKDSDLHLETAKVIYQTDEINQNQREVGKDINHALLYGGGDAVLEKILGNLKNKSEILENIKEFLSPILSVAEYTGILLEEFGYLQSNFGTIVKPKKKYAAYNNFIQLTASEVVINKLYEIREFIKNKKIDFMFQVHDSFVFDFDSSELGKIEELKNLLNSYKGFDFSVEYKIGNNLYECQ